MFFEDEIDDRLVSRIGYPTLEQVERSVAIERLRWMRQLPYPRNNGERRIYAALRARGWHAAAAA